MATDFPRVLFVSKHNVILLKQNNGINSSKIIPTDKRKQSYLLDERIFLLFMYLVGFLHLNSDF